jgi:hypothetical protein
MKQLLAVLTVSLAGAVLLLATFHHVRAQGQASGQWSPVQANVTSQDNNSSVNRLSHTLYNTFFYQLPTPTSEPAGPVPIGNPITFKCWLPCTLEIAQTAQIGLNETSGNRWGLGGTVDGVYVTTPYVGEAPTDDTFDTRSWDFSMWLKPGHHTVQPYFYSDDGLQLGHYQATIRVYVP